MEIRFTEHALEEYKSWVETDDKIVDKIKYLILDIKKDPFKGIGKPEALRHSLKGYWSRRITKEHRLVYKVEGKKGSNQKCIIIQCMYHYDD